MSKIEICLKCRHREKPVDDKPCDTCMLVFYADGHGYERPTPSNFEYDFTK